MYLCIDRDFGNLYLDLEMLLKCVIHIPDKPQKENNTIWYLLSSFDLPEYIDNQPEIVPLDFSLDT